MKKMMFLLLISFLAMNCQKEVITPDNGEKIGKPDTTKKPAFELTIKNLKLEFVEKANIPNYELNVGFDMDVYWINNTIKDVSEPVYKFWAGDTTYWRGNPMRFVMGAKKSGQYVFITGHFYKHPGTYHVKVEMTAYIAPNDSITANIEKDFVLKL